MSKKKAKPRSADRGRADLAEPSLPEPAPATISRDDYDAQLHILQVELVKLQRHFIRHGQKTLIILEGRDAAGKDGSIKRIVEHLSPRETRVVALGRPSDRDCRGWYFQRYVSRLPVTEELVIFNRSWYNRAGVERVMQQRRLADHERDPLLRRQEDLGRAARSGDCFRVLRGMPGRRAHGALRPAARPAQASGAAWAACTVTRSLMSEPTPR